MFWLDATIDELLALRQRMYLDGVNFIGTEQRARDLADALPLRSDVRTGKQRGRIDLANALAFDTLGGVARVRGEYFASTVHTAAAERLYRSLGLEFDAERMAISNLTVAVQTGHIDEAAEQIRRSARRLAASRFDVTRNEIVARQADLLVAIGRASEAVALQRDRKLIEMSRRAEEPVLTAGRLFYLARAQLASGERDESERSYEEGIELLGNAEHAYFRIQGELTYALLCLATQDHREAERALERAVAIAIAEGVGRNDIDTALATFRRSV